jgi:F0F1-type ATP synthase gamma subunit
VVLREYLYLKPYWLLFDALAAEHGMRLVAAENALRWIEDTQKLVHRQLSAARREVSTQEGLEIVGVSGKLRRNS